MFKNCDILGFCPRSHNKHEESVLAAGLIAEDDETIKLLTGHHLKQRHSVLFAGDGKEALETISTRRVDLLVADIMMPRMDGFDHVRNIRKLGLSLPVIMLTPNQSFILLAACTRR